jgi:hypothetical protein
MHYDTVYLILLAVNRGDFRGPARLVLPALKIADVSLDRLRAQGQYREGSYKGVEAVFVPVQGVRTVFRRV